MCQAFFSDKKALQDRYEFPLRGSRSFPASLIFGRAVCFRRFFGGTYKIPDFVGMLERTAKITGSKVLLLLAYNF